MNKLQEIIAKSGGDVETEFREIHEIGDDEKKILLRKF